MKIAIIDYNAGNVRSVLYAMERLGREATLTANHQQIREADKVIFPGVGEARTTMNHLREKGLDEVIRSLKQPVLGICLGMQLLCDHSEENDADCLGIIPQHVVRFRPNNGEKVPHMGWNQLRVNDDSWLDPSLDGEYVYFVHSYFAEIGPYTAGVTDYIQPFSSVMRKDNFYATQFHPEKSGEVGRKILETFLEI